VLLNTGAFTLPAGLRNNPALTLALAASGGIDKLPKEAPLHLAYLTGAIAAGTPARRAARFTSGTMTFRTNFRTRYIDLFFAAQSRLLKGN